MTLITDAAATQPREVEAFCGRWGKAWNDHDAEAVAALCADDLVYDEPSLGDATHGRDVLRDYVARLAVTYPDHTFRLCGLYADVRRRAVNVAWLFTGTHARTGRKLEFHGDDRLELDADNLISAYRCVYDYSLVQRQLDGSAVLL